jgi:hypothetical protein
MMKKDANVIKRPIHFPVKPMERTAYPALIQQCIERAEAATIDNRAPKILTDKEQKALNAWGLSLNEFGAYLLRVPVPLMFKLKGLSRDYYHIALKTDIPELAIKRAKQIKAVTKRFFGEQRLIIDELATMEKMAFTNRILIAMYKVGHRFKPEFEQPKEALVDFPEFRNLDLSNIEDHEAFPYAEWWLDMLSDKLSNSYSPLQLITINACLQPFFHYAKSELHRAGHTSFPTIKPDLIQQYFVTLTEKERKEHRDALHFFFRNLNQIRNSAIHTRKVLSPSLYSPYL